MDILVHLKSAILTESLVGLLASKTTHRVRGHSTCRADPPADIVVCDGSSCREEARCTCLDESKVILLDTGMREQEVFAYLVTRGIDGVLTKDMPPEMVGRALSAVERGDFWLPHRDFRAILNQAEPRKGRRIPELSEKHRRIVELVAGGWKNREIAEELHLSEQTIKAHVSRILHLLNVSTRTQLVRLFLESRL